jgi:DNA polymerase III alpha subunit
LWEEYGALGFLRSQHPLALWKDAVASIRRIKAKQLAKYLDNYVCLIGWPVTQKEVWTKGGLAMSFLTFEDETALYETVIFPKVYDQYHKLLFDQQPLLMRGWVKEDHGAVSLEVDQVALLENSLSAAYHSKLRRCCGGAVQAACAAIRNPQRGEPEARRAVGGGETSPPNSYLHDGDNQTYHKSRSCHRTTLLLAAIVF